MTVPVAEFFGRVQPTEVQVAVTVPEPAAHLHQCVVHAAGAQVIRHGQTFQGQPSREFVSPDGNHVDAIRMLVIVKDVAGLSVYEFQPDALGRLAHL